MGYSLFAPGFDPMLLEVMFKLDSELLDKWKMVVAQLARQVSTSGSPSNVTSFGNGVSVN